MERHTHTKLLFAGARILSDQPVVGVAKLAAKSLVVVRTKPLRFTAFRLSGMLTANPASPFLMNRYQERICFAPVYSLPEEYLLFNTELTPVPLRKLLYHYSAPLL
jgi:hypothetical protein